MAIIRTYKILRVCTCKYEKKVIHLTNFLIMRSPLKFGGQIKTKYHYVWQMFKEILLLPYDEVLRKNINN